MQKALDDPEARIEILELSRFPVPRGELEFQRATLPVDTDAPVVWRGMVRYAGGRKFGVWASVKVRVRGVRCGRHRKSRRRQSHSTRPGEAGNVRGVPGLERSLRHRSKQSSAAACAFPMPAGGIIPAGMLDAPEGSGTR